ncbi:vanillate O-demethylase ferredoxin subunit [Roseovarius tolerans]|uniref:Vanillate O-demethylase ferredoxin subunit n=1 Tax=Roseovarius tolerans TaxID=74031 RepID=A0A1H8D9Z9_9RHOB|nr:PDR/VanB family oxidoreductase [Roseovarius tolerans]SEN03945.1 vanillate O-demethylase ferredoxin subunit [Roseovarius tolerans]
MRLIVAKRGQIAEDTLQLDLIDPSSGDLPSFDPGAHIELSFAGMVRRYSLTSYPDDLSRYSICVLRTSPGTGGSAYIHDQLAVGDVVDASAPQNAFRLETNAVHSVFIAGGIGITPFLSMIERLEIEKAEWELHYSGQVEGRLLPLPFSSNRVSRYLDRDRKPTLDVPLLLDGLDRNTHLYVCGPRPLIEAVRIGASARGWLDSHIHFESFGAVTKRSDTRIELQLAMTGTTVTVPAGTTILDALLDAGVWAPFECRRGTCGSCHIELLAGEADHRDHCLTPAQRAHGLCTCVSRAKTDTLRLNI